MPEFRVWPSLFVIFSFLSDFLSQQEGEMIKHVFILNDLMVIGYAFLKTQ